MRCAASFAILTSGCQLQNNELQNKLQNKLQNELKNELQRFALLGPALLALQYEATGNRP
jgi:hypothetical protein